jgi:hypothetical protein
MGMTVREWEARLRTMFSESGVVGPSLLPIHHAEEVYEQYVGTSFFGYRVLNQSFLEFFYQTLRQAESFAKREGAASIANSYGATLLFYANIFNRFRAAEVLFLNGYPLDAFALLRDLKDRAIYLSGLIDGRTSLAALLGIAKSGQPASSDRWEAHAQAVERRRNEQRRVMSLVVGSQSGLEAGITQGLRRWQSFFHDEVHLSILTFSFESGSWAGDNAELPIGPHEEPLSAAMYMNRSCEVAWLLLRTLPFLQHEAAGFGSGWADRWSLLDESIRYAVETLQQQGKELVGFVVALVEKKFSFGPSTSYRDKWTGS